MEPFFRASIGYIRLTPDGYEDCLEKRVPPWRSQTVHYDFMATGECRIEFYMTVDGKLSLWSFEGDEWEHERNLPVEIKGPFLLCNGGQGVVAERDGHWCLIEPLDVEDPDVQPIVKKDPEHPLLLIEDAVTGTSYFLQDQVLYDEQGEELRRLPEDLRSEAKLIDLAEFVWQQRPQE